MTIDNNTICIVDISTFSLWDYAENKNDAEKKYWKACESVQESIKRWEIILGKYGDDQARKYLKKERNRTFDIMTLGEFENLQRQKILSDPMQETNKDTFSEMLDVLPPIYWCTIDGVEMFCMSEMYTGTYTTQYAHDKNTNKFYCKMVDCCDRSTWIYNFLR